MTRIYRWRGRYFGFILNGRLFDANSKYMGWVEDDGWVWRHDGRFVGELVEESYVLRCTNMVEPVARVARVPPVTPVAPVPPVDRVGRVERVGWSDALDDLSA